MDFFKANKDIFKAGEFFTGIIATGQKVSVWSILLRESILLGLSSLGRKGLRGIGNKESSPPNRSCSDPFSFTLLGASLPGDKGAERRGRCWITSR